MTKKMNLAARTVQLILHVFLGAQTVDIKKHIQTCLNGQTPESVYERIIFMLMFNDIDLTKKGSTEICLHTAKEVAAFATQLRPGHWCCQKKKTWWNGNSNETSRTMGYYRFVDGWHIQVSHHTSHPMCPATESFSLGQMRKRGTNYHFQGTLDILAGNILCVYNCICQWYDTENGTYAEKV